MSVKLNADTCAAGAVGADCARECQYTAGASCGRNGTTNYESCGSSKCSSGQICKNGNCLTVVLRGFCCDDKFTYCDRYSYCISDNKEKPDCSDMKASCKAIGGKPVYKSGYCDTYSIYNSIYYLCE